MSRRMLLGLCVAAACVCSGSFTFAQGLVWNAPDEGTEVIFESNYTQVDERPNDADKRLNLEPWRRRLSIKALRKVDAQYNGQTVPCQWFEFKVITASERGGDGELVPGPGGKRIYKVLVPLERASLGPPVAGKVVDQQGIPIAYLPIVQGFRRLDEQAAQPITSGVFDTFPMVTLMANYRELEVLEENGNPGLDNSVNINTATHYRGEQIMESPTNRTTNKAEIWANDMVPFGLVRWSVTVTRETKDGQASRDQFQLTSTYSVDMKLVSQNSNATSDLQEGE